MEDNLVQEILDWNYKKKYSLYEKLSNGKTY